MQSLYFLAEALDGMQQIFYLCGPGTDGLGLKVVGERLVELRPAADSLGHEQWNYGCRIPLQHLSLLPFLNGPCCLADMVHCVSEFAQQVGINLA